MPRRLEQLMMHTLGLEPEARDSFVARISEEDPHTGERLRRHLASLEADASGAGSEGDGPLPERIGAYQILETIGKGGMGTVYLARQDEPEREVALKVINPSRVGPDFIDQFCWEYRVLARMNHNHVARIYEVGMTAEGRPFFTMEHIRGRALNAYVAGERLDLEARIRLFLQVCDGVLHAHQKGVVHRDLKPANIIVCEEDGEPVAKVIDFGIARGLDDPPAEPKAQTLGTPAYMSPEQVKGLSDADIRGDIYALGLILHEVLTGRHPLDGVDSREQEAVLVDGLSITACRLAAGNSGADEADGYTRRWVREMRRDLDWIIARAAAPNPESRYASVAEFREDLERYLDGRPVEARPSDMVYRCTRFVGRNLIAVGAVTVVMLALVFVLVNALFSKRKYRLLAEDLQLNVAFIEDMLSAPDPRASGIEARIVDTLPEPNQQIHGSPLAQANIQTLLGKTRFGLGQYTLAQQHFENALHIRLDILGPNDPLCLSTRYHRARALRRLKRDEEALTEFEDIAERQKKELGPNYRETLLSLAGAAMVYQKLGQHQKASDIFQEVWDRQKEALGEDDPDTLRSQVGYATALYHLEAYEEADRHFDKALGQQIEIRGSHFPETLATMVNLGNLMIRRKEYQEAYDLFLQVYEVREKKFGEHPLTDKALFQMGRALRYAGRDLEAKNLLLPLVEWGLKKGISLTTLKAANELVNVSKTLGDMAIAAEKLEAVLRKWELEGARGLLGQIQRAKNNLGDLQNKMFEYTRAEKILVPLLGEREAADPISLETQITRVTLAQALWGQARKQEALLLSARAWQAVTQNRPSKAVRWEIQSWHGYFLACSGKRKLGLELLQECLSGPAPNEVLALITLVEKDCPSLAASP